jgi:hypothetical protein
MREMVEPKARTAASPEADCRPVPPDEHPRLTALLEALAMAGAIWDLTGAMAVQAWRWRQAADCEDGKGAAR